ncbi:HD domain-containing protein [Pontibacillus sp. HMF3514]|nr:HD domain-containing protein [Pontibacillus sp. HMF3514]QHE54198.1 HD domain-containing protein [Pontibacillus sp. HMF3514]
MHIEDKIYGSFDINEEVLQELLTSNPVQRLKGIHQGGASYLVNPEWNVTRYDHSVGVMLLIRLLGGSVDEQAAGLLHDVSHTAFSHVIDFVLDYENQDYHEEIFEEVISQSDIPEILKRHGLDIAKVMDEENWKILEQPLPDLCADRIDYTLRDMNQQGMMHQKDIDSLLKSLRFNGEKVYVDDDGAAEWFVRFYYKEVIDYFLHPLNVYGYQVLSQSLKEALQRGVITREDFLLTDEELLHKVKSSDDSTVQQLLGKLHPNVEVEYNEHDYDYSQHSKLRYIDPLVQIKDGNLVPVSQINQSVKEATARAKTQSEKGTYVKVLST